MIHIVQALCPQRHCIMAMAFDDDEMDDKKAILKLAMTIARAQIHLEIDPWCDLCKAEAIQYEVGRTGFKTMEEAAPHIKASEERRGEPAKRSRHNAINRHILSA